MRITEQAQSISRARLLDLLIDDHEGEELTFGEETTLTVAETRYPITTRILDLTIPIWIKAGKLFKP